ncbi:MAG: hypothetical protein ABIE23_05460 [archaeon]
MVSKEIGRGKPTVSERLQKLVKQELVKKKDSLYYLTTSGQMACSALARLLPNEKIYFRLHKYTFSAPFLKKSPELEERLAVGKRFSENYNFDKAQFHTKKDSVTVQFYSNSINFVLPPVYSPDLIVAEAGVARLSNIVIDLVEEAFPGTKVGTSEVSSHVDDNHIAVVNHPMTREFEEFRKKFDETYCFKGDRLEVDFSEGAPEMEFTDRLHAKEDCYKVAKFCNWVVKGNNLEKIMKLVES